MRTRVINSLLADMSVFVQVADHGSFAEAARIMGMTPSALSRQVSRLEDALSNKLLERTTRQLCLTEFGRQTYVLCRQMVDSAGEVVDLAQSVQQTPQGVLRVSAPRAFGKRVVHPLVAEFLDNYPNIDIQLIATDRFVDAVTDQLDIIIDITEKPRFGFTYHTLFEVKQCLCASQQYLAAHGTPKHPKELTKFNCITLGNLGKTNTWVFTKKSERVTVNAIGRYSINSTESRLDSVIEGRGITALPDFTASDALNNGDIVEVLSDWNLSAAFRGYAYIQYPPTKHLAPKTSVFIQYLMGALAKQKLNS